MWGPIYSVLLSQIFDVCQILELSEGEESTRRVMAIRVVVNRRTFRQALEDFLRFMQESCAHAEEYAESKSLYENRRVTTTGSGNFRAPRNSRKYATTCVDGNMRMLGEFGEILVGFRTPLPGVVVYTSIITELW